MMRRSIYMYGSLLRPGERGLVGAGLGVTTPRGDPGLVAPTRIISRTGEKLVIDGVEMVFQLTPGTEAPTEMNTYFPQFKALWLAENCSATLRNLYTLRGAEIRDGLKWTKYIEYMGGIDAILTKTARDMERGEYRFAAEALKHAVFAEPNHRAARLQLADCLEQMGYQAESGPWRNFYLQDAFELRHGVPKIGERGSSPDMLLAMPAESLFDYMAVHVNGEQAAALPPIRIDIDLADVGTYALVMKNGVLHSYPASEGGADKATATLSCSRLALIGLVNHPENFAAALEKGLISVTGETNDAAQLFRAMEAFEPGFEIVAP